jgi:hypothetical protein
LVEGLVCRRLVLAVWELAFLQVLVAEPEAMEQAFLQVLVAEPEEMEQAFLAVLELAVA